MTFPRGILDTDRVLPTGGFTSPASGATVSGTITLSTNAADNDQIASVQFRVDGNNIGAPDTVAPYSMTHDTSTVPNGNHTYSALITDRTGNVTVVSVSVTMANAPTVGVTSPANGSNINGTINLTGTVAGNDAGTTSWFTIDGVQFGTVHTGLGSQTWSLDTHTLAVGAHTLVFNAKDTHNNLTTLTLNVTVNNAKPATGLVLFDFWQPWDGSEYWDSRSSGPAYQDRWTTDFIWSHNNDKNPRPVPGNPDPTHYQMSVQMGTNANGRLEGGDSGNVNHVVMTVDGVEYDVWANGISGPNIRSGPVVNVGGGNSIAFARWDSNPGENTAFIAGVSAWYDYALKPGYLS